MSILVFVSVELSSNCGDLLLREETLLGNGTSLALSKATRGLSGFQIHLPETPGSSPPKRGDGVAVTLGPLPTSAWMWGWWR